MNEKMRSSVMGLLLGQFSSPLPMAQKEPVAYLYNGVRLPKLPEWDKETYPYATIHDYAGSIELNVTQEAPYYSNYYGGVIYRQPRMNAVHEDGAWVGFGNVSGNKTAIGVIWTSHDIFNENGSVYLAASDPIPIYE